MKIDSNLKQYIGDALFAIEKGIKMGGKFYISGEIEFDLVVVNTREGDGGFKLYVADAKGKLKSEEINRIKIKVKPNMEMKITKVNKLPIRSRRESYE